MLGSGSVLGLALVLEYISVGVRVRFGAPDGVRVRVGVGARVRIGVRTGVMQGLVRVRGGVGVGERSSVRLGVGGVKCRQGRCRG